MLKPRKRNARPESKLYPHIQHWLDSRDFFAHRVEAAARYSMKSRCYRRTETPPGFSDFAGVTPCGRAAFIEVKALGKRSSLGDHQREFLLEIIHRNGFACVVDSVECLDKLWLAYQAAEIGFERMKLLIDHLPKKRLQTK